MKTLGRFLRARNEKKRFSSLEQQDRSIAFYAEDNASFVHFEPIIEVLTRKLCKTVCYLTSSSSDPILETKNKRIKSFFIGSGSVRTVLFLNLRVDVMLMTMPDLGKYYLKRSKVYPVHYVYVFHSIYSSHMIYRGGAFDNFDTIFCVGPHHVEEIRATETAYRLKTKTLVKHGYGRLDRLLEQKREIPAIPSGRSDSKQVVVAPSWNKNGLLETRGREIVEILIRAGYHVTLRPHPVTAKKWPTAIKIITDAFGKHSSFVYEKNIRSEASLLHSDIMISDWSGVALEYAFTTERPVLFVDIPRKINNPEYQRINIVPLEVDIRRKIGEIVAPNELSGVPEVIGKLLESQRDFSQRIRKIRDQTVYNKGRSGQIGSEEIARILDTRLRSRG